MKIPSNKQVPLIFSPTFDPDRAHICPSLWSPITPRRALSACTILTWWRLGGSFSRAALTGSIENVI